MLNITYFFYEIDNIFCIHINVYVCQISLNLNYSDYKYAKHANFNFCVFKVLCMSIAQQVKNSDFITWDKNQLHNGKHAVSYFFVQMDHQTMSINYKWHNTTNP